MSDQHPHLLTLECLKDEIARTEALVRDHENAIASLPGAHPQTYATRAKLQAAKLRLARLCAQGRNLQAELQG